MLGAPPTLAGRFRLDDTRPWKQGDVLTAVEANSLRLIQWSIPAKDSTRYKKSWETQDVVHWAIQYDKEYGKLSASEKGNWYESAQRTGPEPPYSTEITLEPRSGRYPEGAEHRTRRRRLPPPPNSKKSRLVGGIIGNPREQSRYRFRWDRRVRLHARAPNGGFGRS
jgi:hypothetical protein